MSDVVYSANEAMILEAVEMYQAHTGRCPVPGFEQWVLYADKQKCLKNVANYSQVFKDLQPFRTNGISRSQVQHRGQNFELHNFRSLSAHKHWGDVSFLLKEDIVLLENYWDEPISFPGADLSRGGAENCYKDNVCIKKNFGGVPDYAFFHCPSSFPATSSLIPVFSATKCKCYKDIIWPNGYHTGTPRFEDSVSFEKKKPVVFWRGSPTGGQPRSVEDFKV